MSGFSEYGGMGLGVEQGGGREAPNSLPVLLGALKQTMSTLPSNIAPKNPHQEADRLWGFEEGLRGVERDDEATYMCVLSTRHKYMAAKESLLILTRQAHIL